MILRVFLASYSRDLVEGGKSGSNWREGLQDGQSQAKKSEQKQTLLMFYSRYNTLYVLFFVGSKCIRLPPKQHCGGFWQVADRSLHGTSRGECESLSPSPSSSLSLPPSLLTVSLFLSGQGSS